ncbi:MAG: leucine-rich repeat domain-containing protein, partial [Eubacteriales bacterium]
VYKIPDYAVDKNGKSQPVIEILNYSVSNSENLKEVFIGLKVKAIQPWAFSNCINLNKIVVDKENPNFTSLNGVLYSKDMKTLLLYPNKCGYQYLKDASGNPVLDKTSEEPVPDKTSGYFTVPAGVTVIGENAFYKCDKLLGITFTIDVKEIHEKAFFKCKGLTKLELQEGLVTIGVDAFSFCDNLTGDVTIPASCKKIEKYGFFSNSSVIKNIFIKASKDSIELGENWLPNKKDNFRKKVNFEFVSQFNG